MGDAMKMDLGFDEFLAAPEYTILVVTYPDIFQTEAKLLHGKFSEEYRDLSAVIVLDSEDLEKIGVKDGNAVKISSEHGSVIATVNESDKEHPGIGYMPEGAWSNVLGLGPVSAKVSKSGQSVPAIDDLIPAR